jgi:malate dehydrogenase (oxaloacetate-decarboxylating)
MDIKTKSIELHKKYNGKITIANKFPVSNKDDLSWTYTPGVAAVSNLLANSPELTHQYTFKGNSVAVISDGSAVLGLGNIGPFGAYPVMEGKAMLFKHFANIDAIPIVLNTQDTEEIIQTIKNIAPSFGGINLEDFAAPRCFVIEDRLKAELDIPVVHDDQWGTAVIVLAGFINSLNLVNKYLSNIKIVISGAGAAASAVTKILLEYGVKNIIVLDSQGALDKKRNYEDIYKQKLSDITNPDNQSGQLIDVIKNADIFIGLSKPDILTPEMIKTMNDKPIVFALANPIPEIMPDLAKESGAYIVATGRSDFANQLNNALAFPGIFRGALDNGVKQITLQMQIRAAQYISSLVENPTPDKIIPSIFDKNIVSSVAKAIY